MPPRLGLPVVLLVDVCSGWLLPQIGVGSPTWWWAFAAALVALSLALALPRWRRNTRIADALAGRTTPDEETTAAVDRIAEHVDDTGRFSAWGPPAVALGIAPASLHGEAHGWPVVLPVLGMVLYGVLVVALLRRRNRQAAAWLADRPREPGWRSVPPV